MKKILTLSFILALTFLSCKQSEKQSPQKVSVVTVKETNQDVETKMPIAKEDVDDMYYTVKMNLIYCENDDFTIKVDRLNNNNLRYIAWNKPKSVSEKPDLILYNGRSERQGTGGGYHFFFENGKWSYVIENEIAGESMGVYLNLTKSGVQKRYAEMTDLKK